MQPPNRHFLLSAKMKEDTGKFMKNVLYMLRYATRAKATLNSEKNQVHSLSHC